LKTIGNVGGGSLDRNNPNQQSNNFEFLDRLGAEESKNVEHSPSRLAKVNMNYNPY
jgi:hypothetical protein